MSIHGSQFLFPLFLRKSPDLPYILENDELTLAFYLLTKDLKPNEKVLSFSRLLWPLLSIQGVISTHIILDGLKLFSKEGKFSNPPRQPLIGHVLRNIDNRTEVEVLSRIIDVLRYEDTDAEEIGTGEESEYQTLNIEGLINSEHLQSLLKLIPLLDYKPITGYVPLDSNLSTELALDVAEGYRKTIETMKGNATRWENQTKLIGDVIDKWILELTVKLKDADFRYSSQINKTAETIDDNQMRKQIEFEHDKIDQWKVNEKKSLIENISVLFKTAERSLQDIIKKNRFFSSEESLKSKVFEDLLPPFEKHFTYLKEEGENFLNSIETLHQKYNKFKEEAVSIDTEAKTKLEALERDLNLKLQNRDRQLSEYKKEKEEQISNLKNYQNQIETLFKKANEIIESKANKCLQDANDLISWAIKDTQDELFSKPIQWIYMPLYAMFIEDEDLIEERMYVVFPGYVGDINDLYEELSESFVNLKSVLNEKIEDDIRIRSNFEFSNERLNLIKDPKIREKIQMGITNLRKKSLLDDAIEAKIRENLELIL